jgi:TRAP-type mannitol/chloroaromatic compound transport system permease small subunit
MILLGASFVLRLNEHVRVDIFYSGLSARAKLWVDTLGIIFFLLPSTILLTWLCYRYAFQSYMDNERSFNSGGLPYWPIKMLMPFGFFMLTLQGLSELVKRIAALRGIVQIDLEYKKPDQ